MFADSASKCLPMACIVECDGMTTARRSEPSHAVRKACWRQSYLCIAKALPDFAKNPITPDANVVKLNLCVTPGRIAIHGVEYSFDGKARRIHVDQ